VISPGIHNRDAGPDFFTARLRIDGTIWAGDVEIHTRASDWRRHGHDRDPAYDSVILHVVSISDDIIHRSNGSPIPQIVLRIPERVMRSIDWLLAGSQPTSEAAGWTHVLDEETMRDLSGDGQGLVAVAEVPANPEPREALTGARLAVATLDVSDPGNLGTIVRTADAAGAGAVLIGRGSVELYAPKVIRAAAGSHFHLPCARGVEPEEIVAAAHAAGMQVLAADGAGEWDLPVLVNAAHEARILGVPPECPDLRDPVLWILGNEARGFAGRRIEGIDARVAIPIYGRAESLNVSMACAVTAYLTALS